ncbi:hypothetical protein Tco_0233559 [Tanacetum coccineum]
MDKCQAMIDADYQMAQQMQAKEQEKLSIEEKSKLFVQLLEARKKHFAAMRAQEKRNKPPTKAQKRKTMSTYLKNMAGYKHNQLKNKSFDDIQKLFDKAMKRVNTFVDMDTELVEGSEVRAEADKETAELQRLIEIVPDKEGSRIDSIPLATKPPSMLTTRSKRRKKPLPDNQGLIRFKDDYRVLDWKIYDSCGVHSLRMQHMHIHMLVERRYPLTPATITDMLNKKLQCDHFSEMGSIVGIKRLHNDLEVNAAKVCVTAAKLKSICYKEMDQESAHMVAALKVRMLKLGEYELWRMMMEQYIQMIDYSLWEVIENGNAPPITKVVEGVKTTIAPTTAEEKA